MITTVVSMLQTKWSIWIGQENSALYQPYTESFHQFAYREEIDLIFFWFQSSRLQVDRLSNEYHDSVQRYGSVQKVSSIPILVNFLETRVFLITGLWFLQSFPDFRILYKSPFASKFSWKKRRSLYCVQTSSSLFVGMWRVCTSSKIKHPGGSEGFVL